MAPKLNGKVAVITGSSDGIGAAIALEYAREGSLITLTGRNEEKLKKMAEECKKLSPGKNTPMIVIGDLTDELIRKELINKTKEKYGKIDILINNAGHAVAAPVIGNVDMSALDSMLDIHVRVPYHLTKLTIPELIATKGVLINVSSVAAFRPLSPFALVEYSMAKASLDQFTQWMARELGPHGVRANSINPGSIKTNIDRATSHNLSAEERDKLWEHFGSIHALQRIGQPDEVAKVAVFLASDDASFITGSILPVDGGFLTMPAGTFTGPTINEAYTKS